MYWLPFYFSLAHTFLHLTDIHLDLEYSVGSPTQCLGDSKGLRCCRSSLIGKGRAGKWGDRNCDTPSILLNATLEWISLNEKEVDFVLYGGDSVGHHDFRQSVKKNLETIETVSVLFQHYLPNIPIIPNQGNHDTYPIDQTLPILDKGILKKIGDIWRDGIGNQSTEEFIQNGYFRTKVNSNLWVYSIDTLEYDSHNVFQSLRRKNKQFDWLNNSLLEVRKEGGKVLILGHIFPTGGESTPTYNQGLLTILKRYGEVILGGLFGHSHHDQFKIGDGIPPLLVTPSLMPDSRNPCFRIYRVEDPKLIGYRQYCVNLLETNRLDKLMVYLDYELSREYGIEAVTNDNYMDFYYRLESDNQTRLRYCEHFLDGNCNEAKAIELVKDIYLG